MIATLEVYEAPVSEALSTEALGAIVATLEPFTAEPPPTLWQRFTDWIGSWFDSDSDEPSWLAQWLDSLTLPEEWSRILIYAIAAIAVSILLAIVVNELRIGGAFFGRRVAARRATASAVAGNVPADLSLESVMRAEPTGRRVELMLALAVDRLRQRYIGLFRPDLTHRELARAANELDATVQTPFNDVVAAAERVTYGNWQPDDESLQRVLGAGETVVRHAESNSDSSSRAHADRGR